MQENIISRLVHWSVQFPEKKVFTYLDENGKVEKSLTYFELESVTRQLAAYLLSPKVGIASGDRVLLVFLPSLDFIVAFLACLRAGIIAVPVYPPNPQNLRAQTAQFASICASSGARIALTHKAYQTLVSLSKLKEFATGLFTSSHKKEKIEWPDLQWVDISQSLPKQKGEAPLLDTILEGQIAFLQYTSGSTSYPKGVMIGHACLNSNLQTIMRALNATTDTRVASWLPQYHDMGLIGSYLGTIWCGGRGVYMSPLSFIRNPLLWIAAISAYQATHIQAPNFAFGLVARRLEEAVERLGGWSNLPPAPVYTPPHPTVDPILSGVDVTSFSLSSLVHCFNAAEPITLSVLNHWATVATRFGWRAETMSTGYGLAEHTVYVSDKGTRCLVVDKYALETQNSARVLDTVLLGALGTQSQEDTCRLKRILSTQVVEDPASGQNTLVSAVSSCGPVAPYAPVHPEINVLIVDRDTRTPLPEALVGELWIHSASVAQGYWGDAEKTAGTFQGTLSAPPATDAPFPEGPYLRTGDLGFHYQGELFVTGRIKDLIIVGGRNMYPQDLEQTIEETTSEVRKGCTAAFGVRLGAESEEQLVLATELRPNVHPKEYNAMSRLLLQSVFRDHGVRPAALLLLAPHTLQKTTSGKVARHWNTVAYNQYASTPISGPWAKPNTVLFRWTDTTQESSAEMPVSDTAQVPPLGHASPSPVPGVEGFGPYGEGDKRNLTGVALLSQLRVDIGSLVGLDPLSLPVTLSLRNLGLDSLSLVQLAPRLRVEYALQVTDAQVFEEGCTLEWLTMNAPALRQGLVEVPPVDPATVSASEAQNRSPPPPKESFMIRHCPCFLICCNN